jgi:hypothetical protein
VIVKVPVALPPAVGLKVTLIVQFAPAATLAAQVLVWAKPALAATLVTVSAALPVLLSVTDCALEVVPESWPSNVKLPGVSDVTGPVPVPLKATLCGQPVALSVIVNVPVRAPPAVGVKTTLIVQLNPDATVLPQVFV